MIPLRAIMGKSSKRNGIYVGCGTFESLKYILSILSIEWRIYLKKKKYELVNTLQWCLIVHILGGIWGVVLSLADP